VSGFGGGKWLAALLALGMGAAPRAAEAAVTPYSWIRSGEANSVFLDSSGNNRNFNFAFSTGNSGNPGILLVPVAAGGPLGGATGPTSSISALWGSFNRAAAAMWQDPWTFPATNYVLEAWVLPVGTGGTNNNVNSQFASTGDGTGIAFRTLYNADDDTITLSLVTIASGTATTVGTPVLADRSRWMHVAGVNDNGMVTFYVNGVASGPPTAFALPSSGSAFVGGGSGTFNPFSGYLDEVRYSTFVAGQFSVSDLLTRAPGPSLIVPPASASVWNGGAAPFESVIAYDESASYVWKSGGEVVAGATGPVYTLPTVLPANSGTTYTVDVTSDGVTVTSPAATLTVVPNETEDTDFYRASVQAEASLVAFLPVDGDTGATVTNVKNAALNATFEGEPAYDGRTDRSLGQRALRFTGGSSVHMPANAGFEFADGTGTVEAIVYLQPTVTSGTATIFSVAENDATYYALSAGLDGGSLIYSDDTLAQPITWSVPTSLKGRFAHVAFVFSGGNVTAYVDGESLGAKEHASFGGTPGLRANIGSAGLDFDSRPVTGWLGTIDEVAVYGDALSPTTLAVHNSRFRFGTAVSAPEITSQPTGPYSLLAGGAPAFRVVSTGTAPLSYLWKRNGTEITGNPTATTSTLVLNNSTVEMSGQYTVTVTNPQGSDESTPVNVTFTAPTDTYAGYVLADNPSAFWRLNETTGSVMKDSAGGLDGTYASTVTLGVEGAPGLGTDTAIKLPGGGSPVGNAVVPHTPRLNPSSAFSIEFWVKPSQSGQNSQAVMASQNRNAGRSGYAAYQGLNGAFWEVHFGIAETVMALGGGPAPAAGRWDHVVATWDGNNNAVLYVNGVEVDSVQAGPLRPNLVTPLEIGSRFNGGIPYNGTVDEVAFYNAALTPAQVEKHFSISWVPAVITENPPATVGGTEAGTLTLSATVTGAPNTYQWFKDGEPLTAATNPDGSNRFPQGVNGPSLVITQATTGDNGVYRLVVSNPLGEQTSSNVTVTVAPDTSPPSIAYVAADADHRRVRVGFDRWVTPETASVAGNYVFTGGLTASSVVLTSDPSVVNVITSAPLTPGAAYSLTVSGVRDQRASQNLIGPNATAFTAFVQTPGVLALNFYAGIPGNSVAELQSDAQFPNGVWTTEVLTSFSTSALTGGDLAGNPKYGARGNNYGVHVFGWITPTVSGDYTFFIRSDDASELWLSADATAATASLIAFEPGCCDGFKEPAEGVTETSDPITLTAGTPYYIEALQKEGVGGDFLQVAWRLAGDATAAANLPPIPGSFLSAYAPVVPLGVIDEPVVVNGQVTLTWTGPGTLQHSDDLDTWTPVTPAPTSPYVTPSVGTKYYRLAR
jgi:hypothetical protein